MDTEAQIQNRELARGVYGNADNGCLAPEDAIWDDVVLDVSAFVSIMEDGVEGWRSWLSAEFDNWRKDGMVSHWEAYLEVGDLAAHLHETADGPPVVAVGADGELDIWEGWHRIAAHVIRGELHVEVILGTPITPVHAATRRSG